MLLNDASAANLSARDRDSDGLFSADGDYSRADVSSVAVGDKFE